MNPRIASPCWCGALAAAVLSSLAPALGVEPVITIRPDGHVVLAWNSALGGVYHIERSGAQDPDLNPLDGDLANWLLDYIGYPPFGAATTTTSIDLGPRQLLRSRFYRVQSFEPPAGCLFYESFEGSAFFWTAASAPGGQGSEWAVGQWFPDCPMETGPDGPRSGYFAAGTNPGGGYDNGNNTYFESPLVDLTGQTSATLGFWEWRQMESGDSGYIRIHNQAGQFLEQLMFTATGVDPVWRQRVLTLPPTVMDQPIKLRFFFLSDLTQAEPMAGWYLDDICVMPGP